MTKRQKDIVFRGGLRFAYDEIQNAEEDREGVILDVVAKLAHMMRGPGRSGVYFGMPTIIRNCLSPILNVFSPIYRERQRVDALPV